MNRLFIALFLILFLKVEGKDYSLSRMESSFCVEQAEVSDINDEGIVLFKYTEYENDQPKNKLCFLDIHNKLITIDSQVQPLIKAKINNACQVLGQGGRFSFIWSEATGLNRLNIFDSGKVLAEDINDLGQVIGKYWDSLRKTYRPFLWDSGVATDLGLGSEIAFLIELQNFKVISIQLHSINNKGELTGSFIFGKFNELKQKCVEVGSRVFHWNGEMHIMPVEFSTSEHLHPLLNNESLVVCGDKNYNCYIWNPSSELKTIENFCPLSLNDASVILGKIKAEDSQEDKFAVYSLGKVTTFEELMGVKNILNLAPPFSNNYEIEKISNALKINNKGQIPCVGWIWGDPYACLLEPIK